jgi:hypothetical protein
MSGTNYPGKSLEDLERNSARRKLGKIKGEKMMGLRESSLQGQEEEKKGLPEQ